MQYTKFVLQKLRYHGTLSKHPRAAGARFTRRERSERRGCFSPRFYKEWCANEVSAPDAVKSG